MWVAVAVAVVASAGNNIGKVLQKQATESLPRLSLDNKVLKAYLHSALWITGLAVDLLGAVLMLEAVANAPVSVVQPVSGCGMAVMAVFSHLYLKEPMSSRDWVGVALAAAGTLGVGVFAEGSRGDPHTDASQHSEQQLGQGSQQVQMRQMQQIQQQRDQHIQQQLQSQIQQQLQGQSQHQQQQQQQQQLHPTVSSQPRIQPLGLLVFLLILVLILFRCVDAALGASSCLFVLILVLLTSEAWLSSRSKSKRRHTGRDVPQTSAARGEVTEEVLAGCQAGCCFGLSAAAVKTGFLLSAAAALANQQNHARIQSVLADATATATAAAAAAGANAGAAAGATNAASAALAAKAAAVSRAATLSRSTGIIARGGALWGLAGVGSGVALSSAGFFCQTRGFKEGRAVVVSTCAAVSSILTAVTGGMVALGESLPESSMQRVALFFSWILILSGIVFLVGDKSRTPPFDALRPLPLRPPYATRKPSSSARQLSQHLSPPNISQGRKHEA